MPPIFSYPVSDGPQAEPFHHLWYNDISVPQYITFTVISV